jgi:hypothetical protein
LPPAQLAWPVAAQAPTPQLVGEAAIASSMLPSQSLSWPSHTSVAAAGASQADRPLAPQLRTPLQDPTALLVLQLVVRPLALATSSQAQTWLSGTQNVAPASPSATAPQL